MTMISHTGTDPGLFAALARAGGFMLAWSPTDKLHIFDEDRILSRCGTVTRSMARPSAHQTDIAAIDANEDVCRSCFPRSDDQRTALRLQVVR